MTSSSRSGGDRSFGDDMTPEDGGPVMPADLDPAVAAKWTRISDQLTKHILRKIDEHQLKVLCELLVLSDSLADQTRKDPTDRQAQRLLLATSDKIVRIGASFGLTPGDRRRMKIEPEPEIDEIQAFINS